MDSPDLARAKELLDELKSRGFQFVRTAPGLDAPVLGHRITGEWADTIYIEGFSRDCVAWRQRQTSLLVPGEQLVERHVSGGALIVLGEIVTWETDDDRR